MEWNQSVDCLSAQTVGKGYFEAVTLMWSPSVLIDGPKKGIKIDRSALYQEMDGWMAGMG